MTDYTGLAICMNHEGGLNFTQAFSIQYKVKVNEENDKRVAIADTLQSRHLAFAIVALQPV